MSDCCWAKIICLKDDLEKIDKIILEDNPGREHFYDTITFNEKMAECITEGANYAYHLELMRCAKEKLPFILMHEKGDEYPGGMMVSFDGTYMYAPLTIDFFPYIKITDLNMTVESLYKKFKKIIEILRFEKKVWDFFNE